MPQFEFISKKYPSTPGCYLMKDGRGKILYVGKAKDLRRRLGSYFRPHSKRSRITRLVNRIAEIEVILLNNETESLILENNLIDRYRPPYNRLLWRPDRTYPYIVLTQEKFPRFVPYQKNLVNGELGNIPIQASFGPYLNRRFRDALLDFVRNYFQLRTCQPLPKEICLRFHMHRCTGICEGVVSEERYAQDIRRAIGFLSYRDMTLIHQMKCKMHDHAGRLEFEIAQRLKEQIGLLESSLEKQVVDRDLPYDQSVVYFGEGQALVATLKRGALQGLATFPLKPNGTGEVAWVEFVLSRYGQNSPAEIIVNRMPDIGQIERRLAAMNNYSVRLILPQQDVDRELMNLCRLNYEYRVLGSVC